MNWTVCDETGYEPDGHFAVDVGGGIYLLEESGRWIPAPEDYYVLELD